MKRTRLQTALVAALLVIGLPGKAGHVVTVIFIKRSREPLREKREAVIADIAGLVYDFFVLNPAAVAP